MDEELGPYRIVRKIAEGGMAEVFLARQRSIEGLERTVVLKRILEHYASNEEFVTMFLDEARLLAALSHPNIAQVFDLGYADDTYYLVMEYVRGPTLLGMMLPAGAAAPRPLPERETLGIILGVAEALAYVHSRTDEVGRPLKIVHRDINPNNVMVSYDGAVKLIDFGIAKAKTKVYETRTGVVKGTFGYIAPEQITKRAPVDHRADVFSLGVLIYEMCLGRHPFAEGGNPAHLVEKMISNDYVRPSRVVRGFPADLEALMEECLKPNPSQRPSDMRALVHRLTSYMGKRGIVVSMGDLARLAKQLVPDEEGPAPLNVFTATPPIPHAAAADPASTLRLSARDRQRMSKDRGMRPEHTVRVASGEIDAVRPPSEEDEETIIANPGQRPSVAPRPSARPARLDTTEREHDSPTQKRWALPHTFKHRLGRRGQSKLAYAAWAVGGTLLMVAVAAIAFVAVRAITDPEEVAANPGPVDSGPALRDAGAVDAGPLNALQILSTPEGATVVIDGEEVGVTPLPYSAPEGRSAVWVRVSKAGFASESRHVAVSVGVARFTLQAVEVDAGVDAGEPPEPEPPRRRRGGRKQWRR